MRVIAIGGSASVGKTTVTDKLARRLGIRTVVHVDDLKTAGLHQPAAWLLDALLESTRLLHAPITAAIDELLRSGETAIIEGEGIEPQLMNWPSDLVCPIFVVEAQAARLRETFESRPSATRFRSLSAAEQDAVVAMNRDYGTWLQAEALTPDQPCIESQPWDTLADRILAALAE